MVTSLKKRVMRRVYTIWIIRKATPLVIELGALSLVAFWGLRYISPSHILYNAFASSGINLQALTVFFLRAFQHLSAPSQLAVVSMGIVCAFVIRDVWSQTHRFNHFRSKILLS